MREIKFRGLSRSGEWVYGSLVLSRMETRIVDPIDEYSTYQDSIKVDKETVGQYTGLKDRNGTEIYEGDIVEYESIYGVKKRAEIVFQDAEFVPLGEIENNHSISGWKDGETNIVIGNVYENPELLEG